MTTLATEIKPGRIKAERRPIYVLIENVIDSTSPPLQQGAGLVTQSILTRLKKGFLSLGTSLRVQKSLPLSKTGCGPVNNNLCFHSTHCFRACILRHPSLGGEKECFSSVEMERKWPSREAVWFPHRPQKGNDWASTEMLPEPMSTVSNLTRASLPAVLPPAPPTRLSLCSSLCMPLAASSQTAKTRVQPPYFPTRNSRFCGFLLLLE